MQIIKDYKKYYKSLKQENEEIYFSIHYEIKITKEDEYIDLRMYTSILYTLENKKENPYGIQALNSRNGWLIKANSYTKKCDLCNSIMIHNDYRSYGIGSFVLQEILIILNKHTPNNSLKADLVINDQGQENAKRRDKMYSKLGFEVHSKHIYIDKISNLNLAHTYDFIKEVELEKEFTITYLANHKFTKKITDLESTIEIRRKMHQDDRQVYLKLKRRYFYSCLFCIILIGISIYFLAQN